MKNKISILIIFSLQILSSSVWAEDVDSLIRKENLTAIDLIREGRYEEASKKFQYVLDLKLRYWPLDYRNIGNSYSNLGSTNLEFFQFEQALASFNKAEEFYMKVPDNSGKMATILNNEATIYMRLLNFSKALIYLKQSLNFIDKDKNKSNEKIKIVIYGNLGIVYAFFGNQSESEKYMKLTEQYGKKAGPYELLRVYNNMTSDFIYKDNYELAKHYFKKRWELISNPVLSNNSYAKVEYYLSYGNFLSSKLNKHFEAFKYFNKAENIAKKEFDKSNPVFLTLYEYLANTQFKIKTYTSALENTQKILILSSKGFDNSNFSINPDLSQIVYLRSAYTALKLKSKILYNIFKEDNNINTLNSSLKALNIGIDLLNKIRLQINSESSQFLISNDEKDIYFLGQQITYEMFKVTGDPKFLNMAFQINEQGRAFSLRSSLRSQNAMEYGDVPFELIKKEKQLNGNISLYNELILNEKENLKPDKQKIKVWEEKLFDYTRQYDELIKFIENNYPKYYQLKYDNKVISIDEIRHEISEKDIIVEYSLMDTILFTYIISKENATILEQKVDTTLAYNCNRLYDVMTKQNFSFDVTKTYKNYASLGYKLYEKLFAPVEPYVDGKDVIIIPDGAIYYVPFEALITSPVETSRPDYYSVPYLIYDHAFSTSYSSTLHFSEMPHNGEARQEILAFAPSYDNLTSYSPGFELLRQSDIEELIRIPGVKKEVEKISKEMKSKVYEDQDATETNFKNNAASYKILHLAMHTILDDNNPLYSKLAFSQVQDTTNDNFLHTYEIYNMKLNADLAVLSSCGSGYGKFQEGEGMQSLARGFTYAGCPSILMTLWEVADQSTVSIMDRFYFYLNKGQSKSEALRNSKLDFLKNADLLKSNPFFWSSFVIIGNSEPLYTDSTWENILKILGFLLPIPLIVLLLYRRYKKDANLKAT